MKEYVIGDFRTYQVLRGKWSWSFKQLKISSRGRWKEVTRRMVSIEWSLWQIVESWFFSSTTWGTWRHKASDVILNIRVIFFFFFSGYNCRPKRNTILMIFEGIALIDALELSCLGYLVTIVRGHCEWFHENCSIDSKEWVAQDGKVMVLILIVLACSWEV